MADAPENTIEGFELALRLGATGVESDVWVTADGVPVLDHDGKVGSLIRRQSIADVTRDQLPEHIPTLQELYRVVGPEFPISLDIKDSNAVEATVQVARDFDPLAEGNLWLCHPGLNQLISWRPSTTAKLINSIKLSSLSNGLERRAAELEHAGVDGLNLFHNEWNGGRVALLHRFGRLALGWGAKYPREVAEVVDVGIDAVYSDHVDRMMAVIDEYYR